MILYPIAAAAAPRTPIEEPAGGMGAEERERLGANVQRLRKRRGLTQRELGDRAGLEQKQVSRIELGEISATVDTLAKLARALDVAVRDLFDFSP